MYKLSTATYVEMVRFKSFLMLRRSKMMIKMFLYVVCMLLFCYMKQEEETLE